MSKKKKPDTAILEVMLFIGLGALILGYWGVILIIVLVVGLPIIFLSGGDDD